MRTYSSVAELGVVGDERDALAGGAQGGDGVDGAGRRLVADPDAAVEIEQDVVVAGERELTARRAV